MGRCMSLVDLDLINIRRRSGMVLVFRRCLMVRSGLN